MSRRGWILFGAMCVIWGIPYLLIKVAVDHLSPATLVFVRTAIGAAVLVPFAASRTDVSRLLRRWRPVLAYSTIEVAVPWFLLSDAERHLTSSLAGLLVAAVPLVGAVLSRLTGATERIGAHRMAGLLLGIIGVAVLLGVDVGSGSIGAVVEIGVVTVCYATGPLIIARRLGDVPAIGVVTTSLLLSALVYAPVALAQWPSGLPPARTLVAVLALATVCTAIAFIVFFALIAEVGPVRATVITYVNPAVAVLLGVVLLGETLTVGTGVGFVLILGGCVLATRRSAPRPREVIDVRVDAVDAVRIEEEPVAHP